MNNLNQRIKSIREIKKWSQEEMSEKMNMSLNAYARLERGETRLNLEKLEQIANVFNMDVIELMQSADKGIYFMLNDSANNNSVTYCSGSESANFEIEKLKLTIQNQENIIKHKEEIISYKNNLLIQKDNEIESLKDIIALLKNKNSPIEKRKYS